MSLKYGTEHYYFCGNCEDEIRGYPYGHRYPDMRPLCRRCADEAEDPFMPQRPSNTSNRGLSLVFLLLGAVLMTVVMLFAKLVVRQ